MASPDDTADTSLLPIKIEPDVLIFDSPQCGIIFFNEAEDLKYTFGCQICQEKFDDMQQFGIHWETKHISPERDSADGEEDEADCSASHLDSSADYQNDDDEAMESLTVSQLQMDTVSNVCAKRETGINATVPALDYQKILSEMPYTKHLFAEPSESEKARYNESERFCNTCNKHYSTMRAFTRHKYRHKMNQIKNKRNFKNKVGVPTTPNSTVNAPNESDKESPDPQTGESTAKKKPEKKVRKRISEDLKTKCELCQNSFKSLRYFRFHAVTTHGNRIPKYFKTDPTYLACDRCHKTFKTPVSRYKHEQKHTLKDDPYHCNKCPKTFTSRGLRTIHEKGIHSGSKPYACTLCTSACRTLTELKAHIKAHLEGKPYACSYCEKRFTDMTSRKEHERHHTKEKPYECKKCGKRFRLKTGLNSHLPFHDHVKCDECGDTFPSAHRLRQHRLKKLCYQPKIYKCCKKIFRNKDALATHEKYQHKDKWQCEVCKAVLKSKIILRQHLRRQHAGPADHEKDIDQKPKNLVFYSL